MKCNRQRLDKKKRKKTLAIEKIIQSWAKRIGQSKASDFIAHLQVIFTSYASIDLGGGWWIQRSKQPNQDHGPTRLARKVSTEEYLSSGKQGKGGRALVKLLQVNRGGDEGCDWWFQKQSSKHIMETFELVEMKIFPLLPMSTPK